MENFDTKRQAADDAFHDYQASYRLIDDAVVGATVGGQVSRTFHGMATGAAIGLGYGLVEHYAIRPALQEPDQMGLVGSVLSDAAAGAAVGTLMARSGRGAAIGAACGASAAVLEHFIARPMITSITGIKDPPHYQPCFKNRQVYRVKEDHLIENGLLEDGLEQMTPPPSIDQNLLHSLIDPKPAAELPRVAPTYTETFKPDQIWSFQSKINFNFKYPENPPPNFHIAPNIYTGTNKFIK